MKKVLLSILFCFGVGLTLMGSSAQVSDDNNSQGNCENVSTRSLKKIGAVSGPQMGQIVRVRDESKIENISSTMRPAPMLMLRGEVFKDGSATPLGVISQGIVKDPTPPLKDRKGDKHTNGLIPLPGGKLVVF